VELRARPQWLLCAPAARRGEGQVWPRPAVPTGEMAPRMVGRFRIERTLGVGMFAKVHLGVDDATGERYALKVMRKDALEALDMAKYARREAFVLRRLDHPNVVRLVEAVQSDKKLFLVMPVAPGVELLALVADGPLSEDVARPFVRQLVDAVAYLHRKGVAHRDLKPENIIADPATRTLQVIDFGLTGIVRPDAVMHTVCGSAFYSAPEVTYAGGEGYSGTAADAWSVGILAYILLTGVHPFVSPDGELMVDALRRGALHLPATLSPGSTHLLECLLAIRPADRCTMANAALHPWLTGEPRPGAVEAVGPPRASPVRHAAFSFAPPSAAPEGNTPASLPTPPQTPPPMDVVTASKAPADRPRLSFSRPRVVPRTPPKRPGTFSGGPPQAAPLFARSESERVGRHSRGQTPAAVSAFVELSSVDGGGHGSSSFFRFRRSSAAAATSRGARGDGSEEVRPPRAGPGRSRFSVDTPASLHRPASKRSRRGVLSAWRTRRWLPPAGNVYERTQS
jgi:serine/threonine protein kinase